MRVELSDEYSDRMYQYHEQGFTKELYESDVMWGDCVLLLYRFGVLVGEDTVS